MGNLFNYLERYRDKTIYELELNNIDQLIFAELSYLNFEKLDNLYYRLQPLKSLVQYADILSCDTLFKNNNKKLLYKLLETKRFENLYVGNLKYYTYRNVSYFSILFKLGDKYIIAYRGTDPTIEAWRENMNMLINSRMPSHIFSFEYAVEMMDKYHGEFYLNGHSKGGNMAVYTSLFLPVNYLNRVRGIYDFDGPGFLDDLYEGDTYKNIKQKIFRFVPGGDVVGIILNHSKDYKVVKSDASLIYQHDLFNWLVEDLDFSYLSDISNVSAIFDMALYNWIISLTHEEKKNFLRILNEVFIISKIKKITEIQSYTLRSGFKLLRSYLQLNKNDKIMFRKIIFRLMKYYVNEL